LAELAAWVADQAGLEAARRAEMEAAVGVEEVEAAGTPLARD
jgi:hypothetical protein